MRTRWRDPSGVRHHHCAAQCVCHAVQDFDQQHPNWIRHDGVEKKSDCKREQDQCHAVLVPYAFYYPTGIEENRHFAEKGLDALRNAL
ncbi:unnamed protein product [Macrosiphum euphorbiae]|uniref:Uncharacterized protein n=1 Tax=Macrosiphum euphorbiae TaxID=13131 RepID=A0AAV0XWY9_9HEMI|nr:unnamed protein product [Macrosiphum euphorbiae]